MKSDHFFILKSIRKVSGQKLSRFLISWLAAKRCLDRTDVSAEFLKQGAGWVLYLDWSVCRDMTSNEPYYKEYLVRWSHSLLA